MIQPNNLSLITRHARILKFVISPKIAFKKSSVSNKRRKTLFKSQKSPRGLIQANVVKKPDNLTLD